MKVTLAKVLRKLLQNAAMSIDEISDIVVGNSSFSVIDYSVVGISLAVVLFCGMYHGILSPTHKEDFLIGGRVLTPGPVAGRYLFYIMSF